ncbi:MAG: hypothetical protein Kow0069_09770 [Promethearchaeota archaeon]
MNSVVKGGLGWTALFCTWLAFPVASLALPLHVSSAPHVDWSGSVLDDPATKFAGNSTYWDEKFPRTPPPTHLVAYDVRGLSNPAKMLLASLQGLVNRENASVYLIHRPSDLHWLQKVEEYHGVTAMVENVANLSEVVARHASFVRGVVAYDENLPDGVNVATFLAGLLGCVVGSQSTVSALKVAGITDVLVNLTGRFRSRVELYRWAFENYRKNATDSLVASLDPNNPRARDLVASRRAFAFFLEAGPLGDPVEATLFAEILASYPSGTPVVGWFHDPSGPPGEHEGVKMLSRAGHWCLPGNVPNLSVLGSLPPVELIQMHRDAIPRVQATPGGGQPVYVTFVVSDGDNLDYCASRLLEIWNEPGRGSVPVGVSVQAAAFRAFPTMLKYYYETATPNEYFVAGPSGAGYCYVDRNPAFPAYLNATKHALDAADLDQVWLLNGYEAYAIDFSEEVLNAYGSEELGLSAIYVNYHDYPEGFNSLAGNERVPVFQSFFVEEPEELVGKLEALRSVKRDAPAFAFVGLWAWTFSFSKLRAAVDALDQEAFLVLRPDRFAATFSELASSGPESLGLANAGVPSAVLGAWSGLLLAAVAAYVLVHLKGGARHRDMTASLAATAPAWLALVVLALEVKATFYDTFTTLAQFGLLFASALAGAWWGASRRGGGSEGRARRASLGVGLVLACAAAAWSLEIVPAVGFPAGYLASGRDRGSPRLFPGHAVVLAVVAWWLVPSHWAALAALTVGSFAVLAVLVEQGGRSVGLGSRRPVPWFRARLKTAAFGHVGASFAATALAPHRSYFLAAWGVDGHASPQVLALALSCVALAALTAHAHLTEWRRWSPPADWSLAAWWASASCFAFLPATLGGPVVLLACAFVFVVCTAFALGAFADRAPASSNRETPNQSGKGEVPGNASNAPGDASHGVPLEGAWPGAGIATLLSWTLVTWLLAFAPPSATLGDHLEVLSAAGFGAAREFQWPAWAWQLFYTPSAFPLVAVPLAGFAISLAIVGRLST